MRLIITFSLILLFHLTAVAGADLYQQLIDDIEDNRLDRHSLVEAAFIVSGAHTQIELTTALDWFDSLLADIKNKNVVVFMDKKASAERIFMYFHTTWLKTYKKEATTLLDIQFRREFNCVSATVLYNLTCEKLSLTTMAFETPTHVYTIFSNFNEYLMVENTTSMGFNIMKNLKQYSQYLADYYPQNMVYQIGLHRLYAYENSKGREISNQELVGLICYNQAYLAAEKNQFADSYEYVLLAQKFNADSRSNQNFEIQLYFRWGRELVLQKKFDQAFSVFADAVYRYEDHADFRNNCVLAFKSALQMAWLDKNWELTERMILEIEELAILDEEDLEFQKEVLKNWHLFFIANSNQEKAGEVNRLMNRSR